MLDAYATIPESAILTRQPLDRLRRRVRQCRDHLTREGILVRLGNQWFIRRDRLDDVTQLVVADHRSFRTITGVSREPLNAA